MLPIKEESGGGGTQIFVQYGPICALSHAYEPSYLSIRWNNAWPEITQKKAHKCNVAS